MSSLYLRVLVPGECAQLIRVATCVHRERKVPLIISRLSLHPRLLSAEGDRGRPYHSFVLPPALRTMASGLLRCRGIRNLMGQGFAWVFGNELSPDVHRKDV